MNGYKVVNTDHLRIWRNLGYPDGNQGANNNLIRIESLFQILDYTPLSYQDLLPLALSP